MVQIVFFGATGHIGGAVLDALLGERPSEDLQVQVLVRSQEKANQLTAQYPSVKCIIGRTEDHDVVETLCREANIVINCAPDITHDDDIETMLRGLSSRSPHDKSYYIHTAGTTLIWEGEPLGTLGGRVWDDVEDIEEIKARAPAYSHATTDKLVRAAWPDVNIAIMSPGCVSGLGPSQCQPIPITVPIWGGAVGMFGGPFQIGPGEARNATIHVRDLAKQYMILLRDALAAFAGTSSGAAAPPFPLWGPDAYYFGCTENVVYGRWLQQHAEAMLAHGLVQSTERKTITVADAARLTLASQTGEDYDPHAPLPPADSWVMHLAAAYGLNMRVKSTRMEKLGWKPEHAVAEDMTEVIAKAVKLGRFSKPL